MSEEDMPFIDGWSRLKASLDLFKCKNCLGTGSSNPYKPEGVIGWSPCKSCMGTGKNVST